MGSDPGFYQNNSRYDEDQIDYYDTKVDLNAKKLKWEDYYISKEE